MNTDKFTIFSKIENYEPNLKSMTMDCYKAEIEMAIKDEKNIIFIKKNMEKPSNFFKSLTVNRAILYLFLAFLTYLLINVIIDPQGAIEAFREGYNSVPTAK